MADSIPIAKSLALCCALLLSGPSIAASRLPDLKSNEEIRLHASRSETDLNNNTMKYIDVTISQGALSIAAKEAIATGINTKDGEWTFKGDVHIVMPNGKLDAESAKVSFANDRIARAQASGSPATFQSQRPERNQVAHGRAGSIDYDVTRGTVRLTNKAWLSDGTNEISGDTLVYDVRGEKVIGNPEQRDQQGIDITIRPRSAQTPANKPPESGS